jgi:hypothetical protein
LNRPIAALSGQHQSDQGICPVTIEKMDWTTVYHTAIYVGGGQIVEATGDVVQLNTLAQWGTGQIMPNGRRP